MKSSGADSSSVVGTLTICCVTLIAQDRSSLFYDSLRRKERESVFFFAELAPQKQQKKEKAVVVDGSYRFLLFPLPDHVCINYAASEARAPKKGHGRVFLC